ncbi:MAG: hypothetical protein ABSA69_02785 [Verrucomicrobiota bacterium]|jgi:hypothetical protein
MKTPTLITLASVALTVIALNASANDALLSPRGRDLQTKIVPATNIDPNLVTESQSVSIPPRARGLLVNASNPAETRNLAVGACAVGSPKTAKTASASCCAISATACTAPKACCASN